jgi:hypothetical protein
VKTSSAEQTGKLEFKDDLDEKEEWQTGEWFIPSLCEYYTPLETMPLAMNMSQ